MSIDEGGVVAAWNQAAETLFGWGRAEAIGRRLSETIIPEHRRAAHERALERFLAGGRGEFLGRPIELQARTRDGRDLTVEMAASALRTESGWTFDAWIRDVTARRRTELDAERARLQLFSTVAHELATPATSVQALLGSIGEEERERLGEDAQRSLNALEHELARLARLVADLRVAAQTKTGSLAIAKRPVRLGELVIGAVDAARGRADAKGIELVAVVERDPFYRGDPDRLDQVVHNLLSNAVKFTPAGGRIVVRLVSGAGELLLKVSDTGPGVAAADRTTIFEREAGSTAAGGGGMGIGLAVTKAIVEAHGGTVAVESPSDGGATFIVHLPTTVAAGSEAGGPHTPRRSMREPV